MSAISTICIAGAGTMGSGIAQVSAQSGFQTILFDVDESMIQKARSGIENNLQFLVGKGKIAIIEKEQTLQRIQFTCNLQDCRADLIIEAIIEKLAAKTGLLNSIAAINSDDCLLATNTSSLSVTAIQSGITNSGRVAGMHFFNPAPLMKLVEVVKGDQSSDETIQALYELCKRMGKTPVMCKDAPGFIVNRVARHYYLESMKLIEKGYATCENVDAIMEASGFRMGPFKLMDLIGMDINLAVSASIYEAFGKAVRFEPSPLQIEKVQKGELGKKTGKGFYQY